MPYTDRCKRVHLQTLLTRRKIAKTVLSYDILMKELDPFVSAKIIKVENSRMLRNNRILIEPAYRNDYSFHQPIACLIRLVNQYSNQIVKSNSKKQFKSFIIKELSDLNETEIDINLIFIILCCFIRDCGGITICNKCISMLFSLNKIVYFKYSGGDKQTNKQKTLLYIIRNARPFLLRIKGINGIYSSVQAISTIERDNSFELVNVLRCFQGISMYPHELYQF